MFDTIEHFHSTRFHELTHWTGHEDRLDRDLKGRFGDQRYAAEELVAELGSAFLCAGSGVEHSHMESADYVANWLQLLREDKKAIFTAAAAADKAAKFVTGPVTAVAA